MMTMQMYEWYTLASS